MQKTIKLNSLREMPVIGVKLLPAIFAEGFVNQGIIHLSNPKVWRDKNICNGMQLDEDDGCFCFSTDLNDKVFDLQGRKFFRVNKDGGWKYFEDTDMIVGTCFYGVLKSNFSDNIMQYGVRRINSKDYCVSAKYFNDFNKTDSEDKKTIIILDLFRFCDLVIDALMKLGVERNEIFLSMVYYVNKHFPFCTVERFPFEYFLKDSAFSEQAEFRLIVASRNIQFYRELRNNNNNISIGNISSFSVIQDRYDTDLDFSIQDNKLIYRIAKPFSLTMDERSFAQLVSELYQIMQNQLPGMPREWYELKAFAKPIIDHLKSKYGVEFRDDWRLYNVPIHLYESLPDIYKGMCIISK